MKHLRAGSAVAVALVLVLVAAGCSDGGDGEAGPERVATIAVIAPLDSGLVAFGRGIRNSVQVAVDEAEARDLMPPGWTLEVLALNDSSDPAVGKEAAEKTVADPSVIGVVGTYNSGVAAQVAPVLDEAGVAMVSPGNTDATLTLGPDLANPERPHDNYFRMVAADNVQGPFLAQYAFGDVAARRVAVVSETKPVSKGLADAFSAAFTQAGGQVVATHVVPDGTTDFAGVIPQIAPLTPDLLFFGGEYDVGSAFSAQAQGAGIAAPVMGGDGIKDDAYITQGGLAVEGDLASTAGAPPASIPSARRFREAYEAADFAEPPSDFGVYAYDAAVVLIEAAAPFLQGTERVTPSVRRDIIAAVQNIDLAGASGRVAFDEFGDTQTKVFTVYRVTGGAWVPVKIEIVKP